MSGAPQSIDLSIVIPVYNEKHNIAPLLGEIDACLEPLLLRYEVLVVDDGSTDGSGEEVRNLRAVHENLRLVSLARN